MNNLIRRQFSKHKLPRKLVLLMDLNVVLFSLFPAYLLRFNLAIDEVDLSQVLFQQVFILFPVYLAAFLLSGSYRGILRHTGMEDTSRFAATVSLSTAALLLVSVLAHSLTISKLMVMPYSVILIHAATSSVLLVGFRLVIRNLYYTYGMPRGQYRPVLIFGAGELGKITLKVLENNSVSRIKVAGFIDDSPHLIGKKLMGRLIYSEEHVFGKVLKQEKISEVIVAVNRLYITQARRKQLVDQCMAHKVKIREVPPATTWANGQFRPEQIRQIKEEDLLGRDPISLNQQKISAGLKGTVVLVTGAAGSIGSEIVRQLLGFQLRELILLDQAESALYDLQQELLQAHRALRFIPVVASVTDPVRMRQVFEDFQPQYVFHAAAYKHVPLMEKFPYEAIRVNIGGTRLVADLSIEFGVKKFVMISTDKAVNPTNVMGASKRICEMYIQSLLQLQKEKHTQFITTRFGNVLGSNGSVVPLFKKQIESGGPVTITHPDIVRYFMTITEACQLVLEAGFMGNGGEIYVFDMGEPVKIYDLAIKMILLAGLDADDIPIEITGLRPGEKLYEELLANEESTLPTHHPKIKTSQIREHCFVDVKRAVDTLLNALAAESQDELVGRMKVLVPEFVSQNSEYCQLDRQNNKDHVQPSPLLT